MVVVTVRFIVVGPCMRVFVVEEVFGCPGGAGGEAEGRTVGEVLLAADDLGIVEEGTNGIVGDCRSWRLFFGPVNGMMGLSILFETKNFKGVVYGMLI